MKLTVYNRLSETFRILIAVSPVTTTNHIYVLPQFPGQSLLLHPAPRLPVRPHRQIRLLPIR